MGESQFQPVTVETAIGVFVLEASGDWTYSADAYTPEIMALNSGETLTETFEVTSFDGTATAEFDVIFNGVGTPGVTVELTTGDDAPLLTDGDDLVIGNSQTVTAGDVLAAGDGYDRFYVTGDTNFSVTGVAELSGY